MAQVFFAALEVFAVLAGSSIAQMKHARLENSTSSGVSPPHGSQPERHNDLSDFRFGSHEIERLVCDNVPLGSLESLQPRNSDSWDVEFSPLSKLPAGGKAPSDIHVCIATEEILGPVRNGGIGTTYAYLAEMLGAQGIKTTILYLRGQDVENGTVEQWVEHYAAKGAEFVPVPNYAGIERLQTGADRWLQAPYNMMRYLLDHHMDVVHVSEWRGSPYLSLLAKSQGLAFERTLFIVKTSSPWLWNRLYGSQPVDRVEDLTKISAERKSVELADIVIGGSTHLLRWMRSQGYKLPASRTFVQPNVVLFDHLTNLRTKRADQGGRRLPIGEIVFFGRLEARKGLLLFCEAINRLLRYGIALPTKISFMGKPGGRLTARLDQDILDYIAEATQHWPCKVSILTEFQQLEALEYLLGGPRLAVMPSVIENSSLAVYEAAICGIPFVASSSGGTPEIVLAEDRDAVLCDAHPIAIAKKIETALEIGGYVARPSFDNDLNLEEWRAFHTSLSTGLLEELLTKSDHVEASIEKLDVAVCIYHPKDEVALRRTLDSLGAQDNRAREILIGLDCDADEADRARALAATYDLPIRFLECWDFDAGVAFNVLAQAASSDLLLFIWSGTDLRQQALHALKKMVASSGAEVLNFFHRVVAPNAEGDFGYLNAAILGSVSESFFRSDLSPMPVMASAAAFRAVGGFTTDYRVLGCEQEFVARCQVQGLACTTALMEMGTVDAWDPAWIKAKCYDEAVSHFRAIRPQMAAAPLALRDLMLLTKGFQAKLGFRQMGTRRPTPAPKPQAKKRANSAFSRLFAILDTDAREKRQPKQRGSGVPTATQPLRVLPVDQLEANPTPKKPDFSSSFRQQLHRLPGTSHRMTGRLLGVDGLTLFGWVCNEDRLQEAVSVDFYRNGRFFKNLQADRDLDSALFLPKDLKGRAFQLKIARPLATGFGAREFGVTLKLAKTDIVLADVRIGHRSLTQAGFDGHCEFIRAGVINGWLWKVDEPDVNVDVAVFVDGHFLIRTSCTRERDDLKSAGIGYGNYGFQVTIPKKLRDGIRRTVTVVVADVGVRLKSGRASLVGDVLKPF